MRLVLVAIQHERGPHVQPCEFQLHRDVGAGGGGSGDGGSDSGQLKSAEAVQDCCVVGRCVALCGAATEICACRWVCDIGLQHQPILLVVLLQHEPVAVVVVFELQLTVIVVLKHEAVLVIVLQLRLMRLHH